MKNRFLIFLKRNYILIILSFVHPLAMSTVQYWGRITISRDALGPFRTYDFYLICFLPIFYFIYGCVANVITKKIIIPNTILTVVFFIYFAVLYLSHFDFEMEKFYEILFFTLFPIVFSMLGTLITAGFYKAVKFIKKSIK